MAGYSHKDWMCLRKRRYERVEDARTEAQRMNESPRYVGLFQVYRCPYCHNWHVGRPKEKRYA